MTRSMADSQVTASYSFLVGKPKLNENNFQSIPQNAMQVQFGQFPLTTNQPNLLIALDIASEGKYQWKVGGRDGRARTAVCPASFFWARQSSSMKSFT